ncbi:MAG: hypothetical protein FD127_4500, partial [Acidimicrobiaceae bacterium]
MSRFGLLLASAGLLGACAAETDREPIVGTTEWIVGGSRDTADPQVVVVYNTLRGGLCSGTLIAPRVVLTAKHCIQEAGASGPGSPGSFIVGVGNSVRSFTQTLRVQQIRTTPGVWTEGRFGIEDLAGVDIGVITLQTGVTSFEPAAIYREDPRPLIGTTATVIGFGQTPSGETGTKFMGSVIYTPASTCQGDSGGPIFTGDPLTVFGVTSFGSGGCGSGTAGFNRIDPFLDIIDEAIRDSGTCVNDGAERCDGFDNDCNGETDETCTPLGGPCVMHMECVGLSCETTPVGDICTMPCDPLHPNIGCPSGLYCG